jgi:hypothetical protein
MEIALCASLTYILQAIEDQREEVLGTFFFPLYNDREQLQHP